MSRRCCCGSTESCGGCCRTCTACPGAYLLLSGGTITDANGTALLNWWDGTAEPLPVPTPGALLQFSADLLTSDESGCCSIEEDQMIDYFYLYRCNSETNTIGISQWVYGELIFPSGCINNGSNCDGVTIPGAVYWASTGDTPADFQEPALASVSCTGPLTGSATFIDDGSPYGLPSPPTSATVSIPIYAGGTYCCQQWTVEGCNGLVVSGATVSVYNTMGGTLLASKVSATNGSAILIWQASCSVYVTASETSGRLTYADSPSLSAGAQTILTMTPASGYACIAGCLLPISQTLTATFSTAGAQTLTFSGTTWTGSFTASGNSYVVTIHQSGFVIIDRNGTSCGSVGWAVVSCPPSFSATITPPSGPCLTELGTGTVTE